MSNLKKQVDALKQNMLDILNKNKKILYSHDEKYNSEEDAWDFHFIFFLGNITLHITNSPDKDYIYTTSSQELDLVELSSLIQNNKVCTIATIKKIFKDEIESGFIPYQFANKADFIDVAFNLAFFDEQLEPKIKKKDLKI